MFKIKKSQAAHRVSPKAGDGSADGFAGYDGGHDPESHDEAVRGVKVFLADRKKVQLKNEDVLRQNTQWEGS